MTIRMKFVWVVVAIILYGGTVSTAEEASQHDEDDDDSSFPTDNNDDEYKRAYLYLKEHIMLFDEFQKETLGFANSDTSDDDEQVPDGLDRGLIGPTIRNALYTRNHIAYAAPIPYSIWQEYVLSYANVNEARTHYRPLLWQALSPLLDATSVSQTVANVNQHMYTRLAPAHTDTIVFRASQTPLIFDTMTVLQYGYASCTGLAILLVNALRTLGIPARLVGTPAWNQNVSRGNHNWVEVFDTGFHLTEEDVSWYPWKFLEPSPNQTVIDSLERDPCERWFCNQQNFGNTRVYAAKLEFDTSINPTTYFPLAWEPTNTMVPGEDVTEYYRTVCGQCSNRNPAKKTAEQEKM